MVFPNEKINKQITPVGVPRSYNVKTPACGKQIKHIDCPRYDAVECPYECRKGE